MVSAVGHEQDTPLCDLAADVRASTPTAAARLVVPDLDELVAGLHRSRSVLEAGVRRLLERDRERVLRLGDRLRAAPALLLERRRAGVELAGARLRALSPRATLERGYAIVRAGGDVLRGQLSQVSLPSVLSFIHQERRSGHLLVSSGRRLATIVIHDGDVLTVQMSRAQAGESALDRLFRVLEWDDGRFELAQGGIAANDEIRMPTPTALLEWARRKDEQQG